MKTLKNELQNIIFGNEPSGRKELVSQIQLFLRKNEKTSQISSNGKHFKKQEEIILSAYLDQNDLWNHLNDENIISNNGILYFIDTIFYLTKEFYQT